MKGKRMNLKATSLAMILGCLLVGWGTTRMISCGGDGGMGPTPLPTATPTPTPTPFVHNTEMLLHPEDIYLVNKKGDNVFLFGVSMCCMDWPQSGFPFITPEWLREAAANKVNMVHMRLGPYMPEHDPAETNPTRAVAYKVVVGADGKEKVDLTQFDEGYFKRLRELLTQMEQLGVYAEIDLNDAWTLKYPEIHPWAAANNINGVDLGGKWPLLETEITDMPIVEAWIRRAVAETCEFPNVYYQDGNELFIHPEPAIPYLASLVDVVRNQEQVSGCEKHIIATNAYRSDAEYLFEMANFHQDQPFPLPSQREEYKRRMPRGVNEYGRDFSPEEFRDKLRVAKRRNTFFLLWRGEWSVEDYRKALSYVKEVSEE